MDSHRGVDLVSFQVKNFRNFIDSGAVEVDSEATVLVGKNEAGKSTLLDALWRLNPANEPPNPFNFVLDYPRWLKKEHEDAGTAAHTPPITARFKLSDDARARLDDELWPGALASATFTAALSYGNDMTVHANVDEAGWARNFATSHPLIWPDPADAKSLAQLHGDLDALAKRLEAPVPTEAEADAGSINPGDGEAHNTDDDRALRDAHAAAADELGTLTASDLQDRANQALEALVPRFFHFSEVFLLPKSVSIDRIRNAVLLGNEAGLRDEEISASRFLRSVRLDPEHLDPDNFEALRAELEAVGNRLTDQVKDSWHQNPYLEFKVEPQNIEEPHPQGGMRIVDRLLHFRVYDCRHRATTSFSARSTGFQWFVSFLAQFSYYAKGRKDVIILLDEPGVSLHAKAQSDLLGYIDNELVPNQQVIYTTHSAWMVPVRKIHRVRTVEEDLAEQISTGATVSGKMLAKDADTLMPLQAALGYDVAQTLFIGPDSLVVEGISEVLYLYDMSDLLAAEGRQGLDQRWHICPAGSVGRIPAMLGLLGNSVDTTVVIDSPANATERGNIEERLYDRSRLIEIGQITGRTDSDIEDLFDIADYLAAFNACFQTNYGAADLLSQAPRIAKRIETRHGKFNHGDVARAWVRERASGRLSASGGTKRAFEQLFMRINKTLATAAAPSQDPARTLLDQQLADGVITEEQHTRYIACLQ